jgi:large subunit ribosomal protein L9
MELILRDDIEKLGRRGEIVDVSAGYGRNYLLPRGLAIPVTEANRAMVDKEKKAWEARMAKEKEEFESLAARIADLRFVAPRKVGESDVLYGWGSRSTSAACCSTSRSSIWASTR